MWTNTHTHKKNRYYFKMIIANVVQWKCFKPKVNTHTHTVLCVYSQQQLWLASSNHPTWSGQTTFLCKKENTENVLKLCAAKYPLLSDCVWLCYDENANVCFVSSLSLGFSFNHPIFQCLSYFITSNIFLLIFFLLFFIRRILFFY